MPNSLPTIQRHSTIRFLFVLTFAFCSALANAQHGGGGGGSHGSSGPPPSPPPPAPQPLPVPPSATTYDQQKLILDSQTKSDDQQKAAPECFLPPLTGMRPATVTIADLKIPDKARNEYQSACAALKSNNLSEAEKHLRKAVKQYQKYPAAWVVLGQVLENQQKMDDARDACSQPVNAGSNYVPAYLCMADISARQQHWDDVLKMSSQSLDIEPSTNVIGYDYNAAANFNLHNLAKAEQSALRAIEIDRANSDPRLHFLLAQIYEAKGDSSNEAAQLREYLKYAKDPDDIAMVTSYLSTLEKHAHK
ncbi:MAG TPA: tetratricopeptide repeat protein [Candidatus Sulfotelmatobacter sp.]|nr:tetratricopeptide repeat protein [Candidatus Sulfotelmatobacter sp.]